MVVQLNLHVKVDRIFAPLDCKPSDSSANKRMGIKKCRAAAPFAGVQGGSSWVVSQSRARYCHSDAGEYIRLGRISDLISNKFIEHWYRNAFRTSAKQGIRRGSPCPALLLSGGFVLMRPHMSHDAQQDHISKKAVVYRIPEWIA